MKEAQPNDTSLSALLCWSIDVVSVIIYVSPVKDSALHRGCSIRQSQIEQTLHSHLLDPFSSRVVMLHGVTNFS